MDKHTLKYALRNKTGCVVQHDGWTCGTCFFALSPKLTNKDWQSLLWFRGDYNAKDLDNLPKRPLKNINKIYKLLQS